VALAIAALLYAQWQDSSQDFPLSAALPEPARPAGDARALADSLYAGVEVVLEELGLWAELVHKIRVDQACDSIQVRVPADLPLTVVNLHLTRFVERCGGRALRAVEGAAGRQVEMRCGFDSVATTLFALTRDRELRRRTGDIAIVLDDFGDMSWDQGRMDEFWALPQPLTFAVLPNEGGIGPILELAKDRGHEIIVHLPMEPEDPDTYPGDGAVRVDHTDEEIRRLVRQAIRRVPGAVGLNNHMGSKATADSRVMEQVLREVEDHGLFFLDSRTTPASVAYGLARGMGVPTLTCDTFVDLVDDPRVIETRLWDLAGLAARSGQAIGIGHDRKNTLLALQAVLPRLEMRGFRFVPLSHLAR